MSYHIEASDGGIGHVENLPATLAPELRSPLAPIAAAAPAHRQPGCARLNVMIKRHSQRLVRLVDGLLGVDPPRVCRAAGCG
jgi:hypothetical protein